MAERFEGFADSWAEAANAADFGFYEVVDPVPEHRWAGGFGGDDSGPAMLEILHDVGGCEVSVETSVGRSSIPGDLRLRQLMVDLTWHAINDSEDPVVLPWSVTLSSRSMTIAIDGEPVVFDGIEIDGRAWAGTAVVGDGATVSVKVRGAGPAPEGIAVCSNWAMPDHGPQHG